MTEIDHKFLMKIKLEPVSRIDLDEIRGLQPPDWTDIVPYFRFYIESDFSYPIKAVADGKIVGIGVSVSFPNTAWIAHIIVDPGFRNRGIGDAIVEKLTSAPELPTTETILLIATKLGEPVYLKKGFRVVSEYVFFKRETPPIVYPLSEYISHFDNTCKQQIFDMDKRASDEDRRRLLSACLDTSLLYLEENKLLGYFLPDLGEGLIVADNTRAGLELMKVKYARADKAVIPAENIHGIDFLKENGFVETSRANRMVSGHDLRWNPEMLFSRIGGNLG